MGLRPTPRGLKMAVFFRQTLFERRYFHSRGQAARRLRVFATAVTRG